MVINLLFALTILTQADPFAPSGQRLAAVDFFPAIEAPEKPAPFLSETAADSLEWWAIGEDWAEAVSKAAPLVAVLATRQGQRIIYSALYCYADAMLAAPGDADERARRRLSVVGGIALDRLKAARIIPLNCDLYPVERLAQCLGLLPTPECATDPELVLRVRAATKLLED